MKASAQAVATKAHIDRVWNAGWYVSLTTLACACIFFVACGGDSTPRKTEAVPTITVWPQSAELAHSLSTPSTLQFSATVQNAANKSVTWLVEGIQGGDSSVGTISETGLYTAPRYGTPATVTVKGVLATDTRYGAAATVKLTCAEKLTLNAPEGNSVRVNGRLPVSSAAEMSCYVGEPTVVWTVNGTPSGTVESGFLTPAGVPGQMWYFPPDTAPASPVTLTAILEQNTETTSSLSIAVAPSAGNTFTVSPREASLDFGVEQPFRAYFGSDEVAASWLVNGSPNADARIGWIRDGVFRSPFSQPTPEKVVVTAVDTSSTPNRFASALVTVTAPAANDNARLHGSYAVLMHNYMTLLGTINFDGEGGVTGVAQWFGTSGIQHAGTITGTYNLDWDGHAIVTVRAPTPASDGVEQQTWDLMFASDDHAGVSATSFVGGVGIGFLERQNVEALTRDALAGTFIATLRAESACLEYSGCTFRASDFLGAIRTDAAGQITGEIDGAQDNGASPVSGSYSLNSDGTGTATVLIGGGEVIRDGMLVAISKNKFLVVGLSGMNVASVIAERQTGATKLDSLKGAYVFTSPASLGRFVADGAGTLSGVYDDVLYKELFQPPEIRRDVGFSSTFAIDEYGRFAVTYTDPSLGEQRDIFYMIAPDRLKLMVTRETTLFLTDTLRFIGDAYAQSSWPDATTLPGRYALVPQGTFGGAYGWVFAESSGDMIALFTREQAPFTFKLHYPESETGKGDVADDFTMLPSFYAVSADKMLLFGWDLRRMR
jgi:hypothetical protein